MAYERPAPSVAAGRRGPSARGLTGLRVRPGAVLRALGDGLGRSAELAAAARTVRLVRGRRGRLHPATGLESAGRLGRAARLGRGDLAGERNALPERAHADGPALRRVGVDRGGPAVASAGSGCAARGSGRSGGSGAVAGCPAGAG